MKSLVNFRDLGGIKAADGKVVKHKRLLRSGEPVGLDPEDVRALVQDYHLTQIIDFRSADEQAQRPDDPIDGVGYMHLNLMQKMNKNTSLDSFFSADLSPEKAAAGMTEIYEEIMLNEYAMKGYQAFFGELLRRPEGAVLFHCFAGKDRTGIGAALVLSALGAAEEEIMKDYLKTNRQRIKANEVLLSEAQKGGFSPRQLAGLNSLLLVQESYLQRAYQAAVQHYGSIGAYLEQGIGITADEIAKLKSLYLEQEAE